MREIRRLCQETAAAGSEGERGPEPSPHPDPEDPTGGEGDGYGDGEGDGGGFPRRRRPRMRLWTRAPPATTTAEDVSLLSALEAFASPDGGYRGVNPALCAILHPCACQTTGEPTVGAGRLSILD